MEKFTINELAEKIGLSNQAVYMAVKNRRVKALKERGKYFIDYADWLTYEEGRWSRKAHYKNGEISPKQAADILNVSLQRVYYLLRKERISSTRKGGMIFLRRENI